MQTMMTSLVVLLAACVVGVSAFSASSHNAQKGVTWQATNDNFAHIPEDEQEDYFKGLCGVLPQQEEEVEEVPVRKLSQAVQIPEHFDARTRWPHCPSIADVRNQGKCGSCYAFGAVEAASDRVCIASDGMTDVRLSPEHIISCCYTCGHGCDGGFPINVWKYIMRRGVVTGGDLDSEKGCYPYEIRECDGDGCDKNATIEAPKCRRNCRKGYGIPFKEDKFYASKFYTIQEVEDIQVEIMTNGPVEVAFAVYEDFPHYKSGVYQNTTDAIVGGHAVKMIGWGVEEGLPYWLCVNSWGPKWGDQGTFKILRGSDMCYIESMVVAGMMIVH